MNNKWQRGSDSEKSKESHLDRKGFCYKSEGGGGGSARGFGYWKWMILSPVWRRQDSHRCSLPHPSGQTETAECLSTETCLLIPHIGDSTVQGRKEEVGVDSLQQPRRMSRATSLSGSRWGSKMDRTQKAVKKKMPGDSPRSEMCFCLHSNTPAATRGTRSNKAEREGSREEVVAPTSSTKGGKWERKNMNIFKNSANIKVVELWVCEAERHRGRPPNLLLFVLQFALLLKSGKASFAWSAHLPSRGILGHIAAKISSTCYMHLHHATVSHRQWMWWKQTRKSRLCQRVWIVCMAAQ